MYLPSLETRFLRLELSGAAVGTVLRPQAFDFSRSLEAFWYHIAAAERRGAHPRWLHREQSLWTPIGTSNGTHCALLNHDGMVEVGQGTFSIEPMVWVEGRLFTWDDVSLRQELLEDWMPVPSVIWETAQWRLHIRTEATVNHDVRARYRFENLIGRSRETGAPCTWWCGRFRSLRPGSISGCSAASAASAISRGATARSRWTRACRSFPRPRSAGFGALCFDDGFIATHLAAGALPAFAEAHDPFGFASGALQFDLNVAAQDAVEHTVECRPPAETRAPGEPAFAWDARLPDESMVGQWLARGKSCTRR